MSSRVKSIRGFRPIWATLWSWTVPSTSPTRSRSLMLSTGRSEALRFQSTSGTTAIRPTWARAMRGGSRWPTPKRHRSTWPTFARQTRAGMNAKSTFWISPTNSWRTEPSFCSTFTVCGFDSHFNTSLTYPLLITQCLPSVECLSRVSSKNIFYKLLTKSQNLSQLCVCFRKQFLSKSFEEINCLKRNIGRVLHRNP